MKANDNFIFRKVADEYLLIPAGETALKVKGLVALSESGALLYQKLRDGCTEAELVSVLTAEYDVTEQRAGEDVQAFLDQMRRVDLLVED